MARYLPVDLSQWKFKAEIHHGETKHDFGSYVETWKQDRYLGRGGFGEVWKETKYSTSGDDQTKVRAVKQIRKTNKTTQELPNLIKLSTTKYYGTDHLKHFVEFFGWFEDQHNIYISMEFIPNHDLQYHIQERHGSGKGFQESEGAFIVTEITKALKFMHDEKVMHRDLKPENILIFKPAPDWQIKLADFGISKDIELASAKTKAGTDGYMAPEVADNNRKEAYTNAVDIWSLGAVTFCIHTGKPPFHSDLAVGRYIDGKGAFPFDRLLKFSGKLVIFIMQLMDVVSTRRPSVDGVLEHEWLKPRNEVSTPDQEIEITAHGEWSAPASAEWPDPPDDSIGEANDYIPPADSTRPSAPASAEWPDPPDSPIGEPKGSIPTTNSTGPSSPPYPKDLVVDSSQPPLSPIKRPLSPLPRIHHAASNPIDKKTSGYDEPLAPRPSSSPAGDVEFDLAPNIKDHSKKHIYVESFRKLHGIDHVGFAPLDQPLAQPTYLLPTQKASEHPPWKLSHADSGYSTASASSALPNPKNAANLTPVKLQPIPAESPQPNDYDLLFFSDSAEVQNCVSTKFVGPLQQNQVRVNLDEYDINVSSGATLSQIENNLIDFNHSNPFRRDKTQQAPQYGPWLPSDNNAKATESRPFQNVFEPLDSNPWT